MSEQVNLPCKGRIRFLSSFGPTMGNSGAIEEVRSAPCNDQQEDYDLDFVSDSYEAYAAHLDSVIKKDRPCVLIMHGQAGDGKTSFVYRFFRDKLGFDLRNKNSAQLEQLRSYHHIMLNNESLVRCEIYCVLDMSELLFNSQDYQQVMDDIFGIVTSDTISEDSANDNKLQTPQLNKIVILAANNGIILDFFERQLATVKEHLEAVKGHSELNEQHEQQEHSWCPHQLDIWQKQVVEPLRQHFLSGHMSQFISEHSDKADNKAGSGILQLFSIDDVVSDKDDKDKKFCLPTKTKYSESARLILFDMGGRLEHHTLEQLIKSFFAGKFFSQCEQSPEEGGCPYQAVCPLLQNYNLLKDNDFAALKVGLSQLIDVQVANGYHINVRAILKLLSNTLLGCFMLDNKDKRHFDCEIIHSELLRFKQNNKLTTNYVHTKCCYLSGFYDKDEEVNDTEQLTFITNPYDNIFGLNLNLRGPNGWVATDYLLEDVAYKQDSTHDQYNVFRIMCRTGLGDYSEVHLDKVIKTLLNNDNKALSWLEKNKVVKFLLEDLRMLKQYENDLFEQHQDNIETVKNSLEYKQLRQKYYALMGSLRRALFFSLQSNYLLSNSGSERDNEQLNELNELENLNLFAVSAFPHAREFLKFWQGDRCSCSEDVNDSSNYSFVKLWQDLVLYRNQPNYKARHSHPNDPYNALVTNYTARKLSAAMAKFLSAGGNCEPNKEWTLFEITSDNSIVLNVKLQAKAKNKSECNRIDFIPFENNTYNSGWYFMASEDSLHLPQFVFRKDKVNQDEDTNTATQSNDDDDVWGETSQTTQQPSPQQCFQVAFPITALSFETLMQINDGASIINFTTCLSEDLLRFKHNLLVLHTEK